MQIGGDDLTIALFEHFPIRRTWYKGEWFYSCVDIMGPLAQTPSPRRYWNNLKTDLQAAGVQLSALGGQLRVEKLKLPAADGRMRETDCANMAAVLRLTQSVKSPNAEKVRIWLAQVGADLLEDLEDTNLQLRAKERRELKNVEQMLFELVFFRGIVTEAQRQHLTDANYAGLYNTHGERAVMLMHHISLPGMNPADYMGVTALRYNAFQRALTADVVRNRNLQGEEVITQTAEDIGVQIRLMIEAAGGTMPEQLPRCRFLPRDEWMNDAEIAEVRKFDWDDPEYLED